MRSREAAEDDFEQFLYELIRLNPGMDEAIRKYAEENAESGPAEA